jgi:hypothetical protein
VKERGNNIHSRSRRLYELRQIELGRKLTPSELLELVRILRFSQKLRGAYRKWLS